MCAGSKQCLGPVLKILERTVTELGFLCEQSSIPLVMYLQQEHCRAYLLLPDSMFLVSLHSVGGSVVSGAGVSSSGSGVYKHDLMSLNNLSTSSVRVMIHDE